MNHPLRTLARPFGWIAAAGAALALLDGPASGDDIDLLRFDSGKPYVFVILDSSSSMNLSPSGNFLRAGGDDHRSRLHSAKKVLHEVFSQVTDIHYGFATFNQDGLRVRAKHWLYYTDDAATGLPIAYPQPQDSTTNPIEKPTCVNAAGTAVACAAAGAIVTDYLPNFVGDILTFGPPLELGQTAGTACAAIPLGSAGSEDRDAFNHWPKLGFPSETGATTTMWVDTGGSDDAEYQLTFSVKSGRVGDATFVVRIVARQVSGSCSSPTLGAANTRENVTFHRYHDFLVWDAPEDTPFRQSDDVEEGFWPLQDAWIDDRSVDNNDVTAACGPVHPHSGLGWEGNYDGSYTSTPSFSTPSGVHDPFGACPDPTDPSTCESLMRPTEIAAPIAGHSAVRPLDRGDLIPFNWTVDNQSEFLTRLLPDGDPGSRFDYQVARFYEDEPATAGGYLALKDESERPIIGLGPTQVANSINDFRCYYQGEGNKCGQMAYQPGFESIATSEDSEWGCRRTYMIIISDGGDNCPGASPCSETANFKAEGIQAWYVRYGNCNSNALKCVTDNSGGESVCPTDPENLKSELESIVGQIRQETRTFASAAVPSVQANAGQSVYLTSFRPLDGESVWDGHMDGFLKPVPVSSTNGRPVRTPPCSSTLQANCWNWDAGEQLVLQSSPGIGLGMAENQRRVFYARARPVGAPTGTLPLYRRVFNPTTNSDPIAVRYDFWRGLDISWFPVLGDSAAQTRANAIIADTLATRTKTITPPPPDVPFTLSWNLGEIFHSNPIVVGAPENTSYFGLDLESDGTTCGAGNPGYRCFAFQHQYRRKMLVAGSNDGMLHVFDSGTFDLNGATNPSDPRARYGNGTGREIFAFIPRPVLPTIKELAEGNAHRYGVDLTPVAADAFIDPLHEGTPNPSEREWRTVLIGGLREGGSSPTTGLEGRTGYFALDLTQPDEFALAPGQGDVPVPESGYVPSCLGDANLEPTVDPGVCGTVPFASPLWEWTDSGEQLSLFPLGFVDRIPLDEDDNDKQDLGETWSIPNVGRLRVCRFGGTSCTANPAVGHETEDDDLETRYVMVVGGGMDPDKSGQVGNWLYMIDLETGQTLYKQALQGSAAAEPAAVDTDQDGFLDRIYIGTTAGYLYRADIGPADGISGPEGSVPALVETIATDLDDNEYTVQRVTDAQWAPRILLDTQDRVNRPIFYPPSVAFLARLNRYVLAVGTGDREDLWNKSDDVAGRFYVFVDDSADRRDPSGLWPTPFIESNLAPIAIDVATSPATNTDFLLDRLPGQRGWVMQLGAREKLIAPSFALSGILFFTSYNPEIDLTEDTEGNPLCGKKGGSRVFVVQTTNANPLTAQSDVVNAPFTRHFEVSTFVTEPFTEQGQNKNPTPDTLTSHADELSAKDRRVNEALRALFPPNCRFANNRIDVKTVSNDTEVLMIAPVPQCIIEKNWREF